MVVARAATRALYELSRRHRRAMGSERELAYHRRILALRPEHAASLRRAARLHQDRGEAGEARVLWERLVRLEPTRADAWAALAWLALCAGETDEALETARQGLAAAKDDGSLFERMQLLRSIARHLESPERAWDVRHLAVCGISHCGSTLMGALLGSLPGAGNVGESHWLVHCYRDGRTRRIDFDRDVLDGTDGTYVCNRCHGACPHWTPAFRRALAEHPRDWYQQIAAHMGTPLLISSEKNHSKLISLDPLLRMDAVVLYRDPVPVWGSTRGKPRNRKDVHAFLLAYEREYQRLLDDMPVRGAKVVLHFDRFRQAPGPHLVRLGELLGVEIPEDLPERITPDQHSLGGSVRGNSTARGEIRGIVPQGEVGIPAEEVALIERFAERSQVMARLAREHDRLFAQVAAA